MIPFVTIELDRPRRLRFGMGAVCEFEQITGRAVMSLDDAAGMSITRELLLAMLRQDDPDLTASDVSALVDEHAKSLTYVIEKVGEAVAAAFGGDKQEKNVPKPTAKTK